MKKFFDEFKKFIMRGNVVDMAVGVVVGSSFTAIVNGMTNFILKPIVNWILALIFDANSLSDVFTMLKPAYDAEGALDLANSIYIDWGEFINTILNFLLVAFVLFIIVKLVNSIREMQKNLDDHIKKERLTKEDRKELKARGIKLHNRKAVAAYLEEKAIEEAEKAEAERIKAEEAEILHKANNPTTEELLKQILLELRSNKD